MVAVASPEAGPSVLFTMAETRQRYTVLGARPESAKLGPVASPTAVNWLSAPARG